MSYTPPVATLSPSWEGVGGYVRPVVWLSGSWTQGVIYPAPFEATKWGETFVTKQQFLDPGGWDSSVFPTLSLRVTLDWEYPPPFAEVNASWVGKVAYAPPSGANLQAQWVMGSGSVEDQFTDPTGFDAAAVGAASIRNGFEFLAPGGFNALQAGQPTIYNLDRYLVLGGIASKLAWGRPTVQNRDRYITPAGEYSTLFGTAFMQGGVTQVLVSGIAPPVLTQKPWASFSPRWVEAGDLKAPGVSVPLVGGTRYLEPTGFEATLWGERIIPESQTVYPAGQALTLWGQAKAWNHTSRVSPSAIKWPSEELRFGTATTWNLRQIVQHRHDIEHTDAFGVWTGIENRNRVITHRSTAPGFLPSPQVENAARPLLPAAIASPAVPLTGMVSHGVRSYQLEGIEPPLMGRWLTVHNSARLVQPTGFTATTFGDNRPANNRRYFPYITAGDQQIISAPMVTFAIREVAQGSRYAIAPPLVPLPGVKLHTRYVEPLGYEAAVMGGHNLHIHWTKFLPRWVHTDLFGDARLKNLTPELWTYGRNSEEFGVASVRTQWRRLETRETYTQVFGMAKIADRRQRVYPQGIRPLRQGDKHKLDRTGPYIPEPQWITHTNPHGYDETLGVYPTPTPPDHGVGEPTLNLQSAYPEGFDSLSIGDLRMTANSIRMRSGYADYFAFGTHFVSAKIRVLDLNEHGIEATLETERYGIPRLSPHTIWAVKEAPEQAIVNHYRPTLHYVDHDPATGQSKKGVGRHTVSLQNRVIRPQGILASKFDDAHHAVELRNRAILPPSIPQPNMGWVRIGGTLKTIRHESTFSDVFGQAKLTRYWRGPQTVSPLGIGSAVPAPSIDFFHRTLKPSGFSALTLGNSRGEPPYAWQSLHVGPPMPTIPEGFNAELFGATWVSLKIRGIAVPGFDAFLSEYDFRNFALRMRVRGTPAAGPVTQGVVVQGFDAFSSACPGNISNWVQYIRPDGNMDNYRKGAPS